MAILRAQAWKTNADLIVDVAALGYLDGAICDVTWGLGNFWRLWYPVYPNVMVGCDLNPVKSPYGESVDFRHLPFKENRFDSVVIDGPYKLNGKPDSAADERYGVHEKTPWKDRHQLIKDGITECARVTKPCGYVIVKCMDQVCSGAVRWQTREFADHGESVGLTLVDRFDMLVTPRPQPEGRRQLHAQANYSTLLILEKKGAPPRT